MRARRWMYLLLAIGFLVFASYLGQIILKGGAFGFGNALTTVDYIWMSLTTILGVVASVLVTGLRALPQDKRVQPEQIKEILLRPGCLIALCVSPVVFYGALISANAQVNGLLALLASFQNGFFWEQILRNQSSTVSSS